jgi:hypothetical protein
MINPQLIEWIRNQLSRGYTIQQLQPYLVQKGYNPADVSEAINYVNSNQQGSQSGTQPGPDSKPANVLSIILIGILFVGLVLGGYIVYKNMPGTGSDIGDINAAGQAQQEAAGDNLPVDGAEKTSEPVDCENDMACFIRASETCMVSKLNYASTIGIFGLNQTTTSNLEIRGMEAERCIFFMQTEKIQMAYPAGIPQEQIDSTEAEFRKLEGRNGTCRFNVADLTAMLKRWDEGSYDSGTVSCSLSPKGNNCTTEGGDFGAADCEGSQFSMDIQ